jgi:hypothetical protein
MKVWRYGRPRPSTVPPAKLTRGPSGVVSISPNNKAARTDVGNPSTISATADGISKSRPDENVGARPSRSKSATNSNQLGLSCRVRPDKIAASHEAAFINPAPTTGAGNRRYHVRSPAASPYAAKKTKPAPTKTTPSIGPHASRRAAIRRFDVAPLPPVVTYGTVSNPKPFPGPVSRDMAIAAEATLPSKRKGLAHP